MAPSRPNRTRSRPRAATAALALALYLAALHPALAEEAEPPILLQADDVTWDRDLATVTATGSVEFVQNDRVLMADRVSYNEKTRTVTASGRISLLEPTGEVVFADYIELRDEMREGFIRSVGLLLSDDSRMAARIAVRRDGNVTTLSRVVYSPCNLCEDNPDAAPLWQLKAYEVRHDQEDKRIEYRDAFLEVYGVPVAYVPFFFHPDPSVKRQSGFLAPGFGRSRELGFRATTPYFWAIDETRDLVVAPNWSTKDIALLEAEYRALTPGGGYRLSASGIRASKRNDNGDPVGGHEFRGHVFGEGRFQQGPNWQWGFDAARSTDDTYLKRYSFRQIDAPQGDTDFLTSQLFAENFFGANRRSYFGMRSYAFQGLRIDDDPGLTPFVTPLVDLSMVITPGRIPGRFTLDANALVLTRDDGADSHRVSVNGGWSAPFIGALGDVITLSASVRGDVYQTVDAIDASGVDTSGVYSRVLPMASIDWRWPLVRREGSVRQVIEPIATLVMKPYGGNPEGIPNEDSISFEFDDTNLFSAVRNPGYDRWDGGPHAVLGVKAGVYGASGGSTSVLFGQSYRFSNASPYPAGSGLNGDRSDYVGRITISPSSWFDLMHRFRVDKDDLAFRRNEIQASIGPMQRRLQVGYISLSADPTVSDLPPRKELYLSGEYRFDPNWSAFGSARRDLTDDGKLLSASIGLVYENECIELGASFDRRTTRDRDVEPSTSVNFTVRLKNLGG